MITVLCSARHHDGGSLNLKNDSRHAQMMSSRDLLGVRGVRRHATIATLVCMVTFTEPEFAKPELGGRDYLVTQVYSETASGVLIGEVGDHQRADPDQQSEPFVNRKTTKKIEGVGAAVLATVFGTVGGAWALGAIHGRVFGLRTRSRIWCGIWAATFSLGGVWVLDHWAIPLLRGG